jgi:hypothetical protein
MFIFFAFSGMLGGPNDCGALVRGKKSKIKMMTTKCQNQHETSSEAGVRPCFETVGAGGGIILSPFDPFFEADLELIETFTLENRQCANE